jgi:hypothetical protein
LKEQYPKKRAWEDLDYNTLKQVARNTGADSYAAMKRIACNNSRWKAANQSED